jgi:DNA repair ATPase RecN
MDTSPVASEPGDVPAADAALESASAELSQVSEAIAELQGRLERTTSQLNEVTAVRTTEVEIGRLFTEAQRFTDAALAKLERQITDVLSEATVKAQQILMEAQHEAEEIRRRPSHSVSAADDGDTGP